MDPRIQWNLVERRVEARRIRDKARRGRDRPDRPNSRTVDEQLRESSDDVKRGSADALPVWISATLYVIERLIPSGA
jgi:hypothetical protein